MTGERGLRTGTLIIGAGQAGLAAGLPPAEARAAVPRGRCRRADRRQLAEPLGLASAVQSGGGRRLAGDELPGAGRSLPDRSRDGRFPRGVRRPLRLPGHERHARGACPAGRGWSVRSPGREAAHRGRPGDRRDGRFPESTGPGGRVLARPRDPATPFERIPQPVPAPRRPRARRRPEPLRRRYRVRGLADPPDVHVREGRRRVPDQDGRYAACAAGLVHHAVPRDPGLHVGHCGRTPDGTPRPERWRTAATCPERRPP